MDLDIKAEGVSDLVVYKEIGYHPIFDIKATTFTRKFWFVTDGHTRNIPASMTYTSVVSREIAQHDLLISALNDLGIFYANI